MAKRANNSCSTNSNETCQPCVFAKYGWIIIGGFLLGQLLMSQLGWSQTFNGQMAGQALSTPMKAGVAHYRMAERGIVGLDLTIRPQAYPVVRQVFAATPADKAGFTAGMVLLAVDGQSMLGLSRHQVDVAIGDNPGQRIQFLVDNGEANQPRVLMLTVVSLGDLPPEARQQY